VPIDDESVTPAPKAGDRQRQFRAIDCLQYELVFHARIYWKKQRHMQGILQSFAVTAATSRHYAELPLQGRQVEVMPKTLDLSARDLNDLAGAQLDLLASGCEVLAGQLQRSRVYRAPG
jgi:hypothetical protein